MASSSTIEEVPESSWAAVEVPSKKGNFVFDFSDFQNSDMTLSLLTNKIQKTIDFLLPSHQGAGRNCHDVVESRLADLARQDHANATDNNHGAILFDSGCSIHMMPLGDNLQNQKGIPT